MQTIIAPCHLCGKQTNVFHNGTGFLICEDADGCMARVKQLEHAEYVALQIRSIDLVAEQNKVTKRLGELEQKLGYYDKAVAANQSEMAKLEAE